MNTRIISFAIEAHQNVNHLYDGKPYSVHLALVAMYAQKYIDLILESQHSNVKCAAWLHDTIEDCRLTYNDIKKLAGEEVAELVFALTNEKGRTRADRANAHYYDGIQKTPFAKYVKMCDRLANARYSKDNHSRMVEVYRKENDHFIASVFPSNADKRIYQPMILELKQILNP